MSEIHNFKVGDEVNIINCKPSGTFFLEVRARIVKVVEGEDRYLVRFLATTKAVPHKLEGPHTMGSIESVSYERYVDPGANSSRTIESFLHELNGGY